MSSSDDLPSDIVNESSSVASYQKKYEQASLSKMERKDI